MKIYFSVFCALFPLLLRAQPVETLITDYMQANNLPGLAALVVKDGALVFERYYGFADIGNKRPVDARTIFMLASISKTITATALMNEVENGRIDPEADINELLPFSVLHPRFDTAAITVRQLLTHSSGIKDDWNTLAGLYVYGDSPVDFETFFREYLTEGGLYNTADSWHAHAPGKGYGYSNVGSALCGYLVERSSGRNFSEYCRDSIFTALGMEGSSWFLAGLDTGRIARPYSWIDGEYIDNGLYGYPDYPDGQLRTTAVSLAKFMLMHMQYGFFDGRRVLDSLSVGRMRSLQIPALDPDQGLIFHRVRPQGKVYWGHNGGDMGVNTNMYFDEAANTGVIVLANGDADVAPLTMLLFRHAETLSASGGRPLTRDHLSGLKELPERSSAAIFPNPAEHRVHTDAGVIQSISDALGRELMTGINAQQADISSLPGGVYMVRIALGGKTLTRLLVKHSTN